LRPLVHVYGTRCQLIYASVIVLDNLNGCSRLICLVLETAAICDALVRSAVYKSSYLLTLPFTTTSVYTDTKCGIIYIRCSTVQFDSCLCVRIVVNNSRTCNLQTSALHH